MFLRKFIILTKQSEQNAKGHAKLEVRGRRGKVSINAENLKTAIGENDIYKGYLISDEKNNFKEVDLGILQLTNDGRGKLDWEFDPNSIGNSKLDIKSFNTVIVKLCGLEDGSADIPLAGYIHKDDNTINKIVKQNKVENVSQDVKEAETIEEEPPVEE